MSRYFFPLATISATSLLLVGCASHQVVSSDFSLPKNSQSAAIAMSVVCKTTKHSTASKVFGFEPFDSSARLQYDLVHSNIWHSNEGLMDITCDGKPHHYLLHIKSGLYHFNQFDISNGSADLNIQFKAVPDQVTYVGRLDIDARSVTTDFGGNLVDFTIYNRAKTDLAYFKRHFTKLPSSDYHIRLARNVK